MKIAYLVHSSRPYDELIETINQLIKQDDHVFIMINDHSLREKINFVYAEDSRVHISAIQEFASEGDLSMARGTILQMKDAVNTYDFDFFINLTEGMIPIKKRNELVSFLSEYNTNFFYIDRSEDEDEELRKRITRYYPFTNLLSFPKGKITRGLSKGIASFSNRIGFKRKVDTKILIGSPYFIITQKSAEILVKHYDYVSETFKLSWYPEELYIPMMFDLFDAGEHINDDCRVLGPEGKWISSSSPQPITLEVISKNDKAFFAAQILADENPSLFADYFDVYNRK